MDEIVENYGLVIVDECHHVAAYSFEQVLKAIRAKRIYGLTATPTRKDGWHKIIYMQCGDIRARVSNKTLKQNADNNNKPRIILATSSSIGEGFDDNRLDTLFLTMPVSWKGRIIQYVGRLHREHVDKEKVIVYDYLDNMKVLENMYTRRLKGYKITGLFCFL